LACSGTSSKGETLFHLNGPGPPGHIPGAFGLTRGEKDGQALKIFQNNAISGGRLSTKENFIVEIIKINNSGTFREEA
jgi:hypothetical protein